MVFQKPELKSAFITAALKDKDGTTDEGLSYLEVHFW